MFGEYGEYFYFGSTEALTCYNLSYGEKKLTVKECNAVSLPGDDNKCCLQELQYEGETEYYCLPMKKSKVVDYVDEVDGDVDVSVDCSSNYLSKALIILLSLLF